MKHTVKEDFFSCMKCGEVIRVLLQAEYATQTQCQLNSLQVITLVEQQSAGDKQYEILCWNCELHQCVKCQMDWKDHAGMTCEEVKNIEPL